MEKIIITEEKVKEVLDDILNEEVNKVTRQDFSRTQFKIEELENSLIETMKEYRKLQESMPAGLRNVTNKRMQSLGSYLKISNQYVLQLKQNVKDFKRKIYNQQIEEKK
jgi:hypothetical protein